MLYLYNSWRWPELPPKGINTTYYKKNGGRHYRLSCARESTAFWCKILHVYCHFTAWFFADGQIRRRVTNMLLRIWLYIITPVRTPGGGGGCSVENTPSVSPACRKRRLNGAVYRNHRINRVVPCQCRTGTLQNPAKCLWRWEPDRRYNFFFSPPAHLCRTYMIEISLHVT